MSFYELLYQNETLYRVSESVKQELVTDIIEELPTVIEAIKIRVLPQPEPVTIPVSTPAVEAPIEPKTITTGKAHESVLVLIDELLDSDAVYLNKILKSAGGMSTESVDLQVFKAGMDFRPILRSGRIKHFISFGVPFLKVNVDLMMNRYEPKIIGGIVFVFSDPLPVVEADEQVRRALWGVLKALFIK